MESPNPAMMAMPSNVTPMPGIGPEAFLPPPPDLGQQQAIIDELLKLFKSQAAEDMQPQYPPWFRKEDWPKPDPASALSDATRIFSEFSSLHNRFARDLDFLHSFTATTFPDATANERRNAQIDVSAKADFELMVSQLGAIAPTYHPVADQLSDRDEAADKADFLYACDDDDEMHHARSGRGPWSMELARTALAYGHIVSQERLVLKADRGEMPMRSTLIDPSTCAWVMESDRGVCTMIRKYQCSVREAIASFDYDGKLRRKLKEGRDTNGKFVTKKQDHEQCDIVEYWDRWWKLVWLDGAVLCGPDEHRLGETPYIVQVGALGMAGSAGSGAPTRTEIDGRPGYFHVASTTGGESLAQKGLSHVHLIRYPHQLREAIMNRQLYAYRYSLNPALIHKQNQFSQDYSDPQVDANPGGFTPLPEGESLEALPGTLDTASLGPLMQIVGDQLSKTSMPMSAYGMNSNGSNVSGFAVETLNESGRDKQTPHLLTLQSYRQQRAEKRLRYLGNWGFFLQQGTGDLGTLVVPRQQPHDGQATHFKLTPQDVRETSPRVRVKMNALRIQNLPAVVNSISMLRNIGLLTRRGALERYLADPNPDRTIKELDLEMATGDPDSVEGELLEFAIAQGELKTAAMLAQRINQRKQQSQQAPPAPGGQMGGVSLPMQGISPGPGSGPQGPLGPRS